MKIAAGIEYDGSTFCGWQSQCGARTVQQCLEQALSEVAAHPIRVVCAGRTDRGVHAVEQVVHFESEAQRSMRSWVLGSNTNLSPDICLRWARSVPDQFHARFSAKSRRYRYVILNRWVRPSVMRGKVTWQHRPVREKRMQAAANYLLGEHDFSTFRALACQARHPVRTVYDISVSRDGDCVYIDVHANAFLQRMVRNFVGVLMTIGAGEQPVSWAQELLTLRDRAKGGVTAPPDGLYLVKIHYDAAFELPEEVVLPRFCF